MNIDLIQKIRENGQKLADLRIAIAGAEVTYAYWRKVAFARDMQNVPFHARALAELQWELKYDRQELIAKLEEQLHSRSPLVDILFGDLEEQQSKDPNYPPHRYPPVAFIRHKTPDPK